jgi:hypothetical protein
MSCGVLKHDLFTRFKSWCVQVLVQVIYLYGHMSLMYVVVKMFLFYVEKKTIFILRNLFLVLSRFETRRSFHK